MKRPLLVIVGLVLATGCIEGAHVNEDELVITPPPTVEFDPAAGVIPFPNNLLINPETGKVSIPPQCNETPEAALLRSELNQLNGFSTTPTIQVTFTQDVDPASLAGRVWLFQVTQMGVPNNPATVQPLDFTTALGTTTRYSADCTTSTQVPTLFITPTAPLAPSSTYAVALTQGIETTGGQPFYPSITWLLTSPVENPVHIVEVGPPVSDEPGAPPQYVIVTRNQTPFDPSTPEGAASIVGINQLWTYNNMFLPFVAAALGQQINGSAAQPLPREDILLAFAFTTQTTTAPLDPRVAGSVASMLGNNAGIANDTTAVDYAPGTPAPAVVDAALCAAQGQNPGCGVCNTVPCNAVGAVKVGVFESPGYLTTRGNGLVGPWTDPVQPQIQTTEQIQYLAFIPAGTPPAGGWPVVIFGHGIGRSKEDLFAIAPQLAAAGQASIAFDWVLHGSRAVRISDTGECAGTPNPVELPQCFEAPISPDLAVERDAIRQSALDALKLEIVLQNCSGVGSCGLDVNGATQAYLGQSLGAIIGTLIVAESEDLDSGVLNADGGDIIGILTNTQNDTLRCGFVNGLIQAGVLPQDTNCLSNDWKTEPAFLQFASTARWLLGPADPVNYAADVRTQGPPVLLQEIFDDEVIPNANTELLGALLGLTPQPAAVNNGATTPPAPTPAVAVPDQSVWLVYGENTDVNVFSHGSLLQPADGTAGVLGTAQMQTDAITFIVVNQASVGP